MRPSVGFAAVKLLEDAGCVIEVPEQTCCGQPAYNSGDRGTTRALAERTIENFRGYDYVVAPSGSCAGMIKVHFPELFADDPNWLPRANDLAARTYELTSFLVDVLGVTSVDATYEGTVTYHDACHLCHAQKVRSQPRQLLRLIPGVELIPLEESEICCGAAGTYNLTQPEMSERLGQRKRQHIEATSAEAVATGNVGCILQIARQLKESDRPIQVVHPIDLLDRAYCGDKRD